MRNRRDFVYPQYQDPPELPPVGFNPVNNPEDATRLDHFWLPDRPDEITEPELFAHWAEMMRPPLRFVAAREEAVRLFRSSPPPPPSFGRARIGESRNWSGAMTVPNTGGRFTRVTGKWIVPSLSPGADPNPAGIEQGSTMWIGLDGSFPWSQGMPQVGSAHYIDTSGKPIYNLWFQWWFRDFPSSPQTITAIDIGAGDKIYANISIETPYSGTWYTLQTELQRRS